MNRTDDVYLCENFTLSKIVNWEKIAFHKASFIINKNPGVELLRYPGFTFSSETDAQFYYENFYKDVKDVFTPPRGNLSRNSEFMFIGIKPGSYFAHLSKAESCWLLGPSSEMLNRMLLKKDIYPYYTNVYRCHKDEENKDISLMLKEIKVVSKICPNIKLVFMGNYEEYLKIIAAIGEKKAYIKVWHPSYLLRSFSNGKFTEWANQIRR